ncbi:MAG: hypothetical protein N2315_03465 [Thermanaerothrix sp.]|nr:hypothetical protein [Thermanaerothrix sp.]
MGFGASEERELTASRERLLALSRDVDRWLSKNAPALAAGAFGAGFVLGITGPRRLLVKIFLRVAPLAMALWSPGGEDP